MTSYRTVCASLTIPRHDLLPSWLLIAAVTPGHKTPSAHKPSLSRRSSVSAGHGQGAGPLRDVDVTQIGVPVVTPRKERPGHKRSLTGKSLLHLLNLQPTLLATHPLVSAETTFVPFFRPSRIDIDCAGSYFPSQPGASIEGNWPVGDESTWKAALDAQEVDPEDTQEVANTIVKHVTTTLARQALNLDDVSAALIALPPCTPWHAPLGGMNTP